MNRSIVVVIGIIAILIISPSIVEAATIPSIPEPFRMEPISSVEQDKPGFKKLLDFFLGNFRTTIIELNLSGVLNCNGNFALGTRANGSVFCDVDNAAAGSGVNLWQVIGEWMSPNISAGGKNNINITTLNTTDINAEGPITIGHPNLNFSGVFEGSDLLRISSNESIELRADETRIFGALTANDELTVDGADIEFSQFPDCFSLETDGTGSVSCRIDEIDYTAGDGLALNEEARIFSLMDCASQEILKRNGDDTAWVCAADNDSGSSIADIWVNETGDTMTGNLNMSGNNITEVSNINPGTGSTLTINPFSTGDVLSSEIDLRVGNDYGALSVGNVEMFLGNMSIGGLNLNGTFVIRNRDGNSSIKFAWAGKNNLIRFAIPMEGAAFAIYNPRSGMDGGDLGQAFDDGLINCTAQGYNNISRGDVYTIDCATAVVHANGLINSGADRGIADDLLIGHDLKVWNAAFIRGNVTMESNLTVLEKIFLGDLDHWLRQNASELFSGISEQAIWEHHNEEHPVGTVPFLISATAGGQVRYMIVSQVGRNNSASVIGNSLMVVQNNLTNNLTIVTDCFLVANELGEVLRVSCDSFGTGADLVIQDSIQAFGTIFADEGLRTNGTADIFLTEGNDLNVVGDTHIRKNRVELRGFAQGSLVRPIDEDFEDGTLSPFVLLTTSGSPNEWTATNDDDCFDETCARASVISALGIDTIMEANFSADNLDNLNLSFRLNMTNMDGGGNPDIFNITVNNNSGSGFVEIFSRDNGTNVNNLVLVDLPSSMNNVSIVSLRFLCNVNVANEKCLVDDVIVNGNATANTQENVTVSDTIIWLGDRTFRIFWNGSDNTLSLPGNITIENVVNLTTNSISLNGEVITNWDNVSLFDDNVLLRDGSRTLTDNWNAGNFNITADNFFGNPICASCINSSMLTSDVNDSYVNIDGDNMTGNLIITSSNTALDIQNTNDSAEEQVMIIRGPNRATAASLDQVYTSAFMDDSNSDQQETHRLVYQANTVTASSMDTEYRFYSVLDNTLRETLTFGFLSDGGGVFTVNQDSEDVNTRIESDNNIFMLHIDGGLDTISFGDSYVAGDGMTNVYGFADETQFVVQGHSTQTNDLLRLEQSGGTDVFTVNNNGDMYIRGDVGIGTTTPQNALNVIGDINVSAGNITISEDFFMCLSGNCSSYITFNGSAIIIQA